MTTSTTIPLMPKKSIEEIYAKEIAEVQSRKHDLPGENWKIWIDNIKRNQRKRQLKQARERDKKSSPKRIPRGKVYWLESEFYLR